MSPPSPHLRPGVSAKQRVAGSSIRSTIDQKPTERACLPNSVLLPCTTACCEPRSSVKAALATLLGNLRRTDHDGWLLTSAPLVPLPPSRVWPSTSTMDFVRVKVEDEDDREWFPASFKRPAWTKLPPKKSRRHRNKPASRPSAVQEAPPVSHASSPFRPSQAQANPSPSRPASQPVLRLEYPSFEIDELDEAVNAGGMSSSLAASSSQ
jgi:hypothetical protein